MNRVLLFNFVISSIVLFYSSNAQNCPCTSVGGGLQCNTGGTPSTINVDLCDSNGFNSINIVYSGSAVLDLISSTNKPISINSTDGSGSNTLQISTINTNATRIDISIYLSSSQVLQPLLISLYTINAPNSNISIHVTQMINDASSFEVFDISSNIKNIDVLNYELIFNEIGASSGSLNLPSLIYGLNNLASITISGNNHTLLVNEAQITPLITVNQLSLKKLTLYDRILNIFSNLQTYTIEECVYNSTSQFLNRTQPLNVSVEMRNNYPIQSILPFGRDTFAQLTGLTSLILIEPRLRSSSLVAIKTLSYPSKVLINLQQYNQSDMENWAETKPIIWDLTIQNIANLSIFPPMFFNKFYAIHQVTLQGTFGLEKSAICVFVGIRRQSPPTYPIVTLQSSIAQTSSNWNNCANTYIQAINYASMSNIECPGENSCQDCQEWASETEDCSLSAYENNCQGSIEGDGDKFFYNISYLYNFFKDRVWLNTTIYPTRAPISKQDSINIGAIIGAICGLLIAVIILGLTVYCIYKRRQKETSTYISSTPAEKYKPSSSDATHVSIATSKSSQSSRYALQQSFFPPMQPKDEIAPPLYTAPSESVGSMSTYNLPSAPPAPRDSVSTHATHLYETLDS